MFSYLTSQRKLTTLALVALLFGSNSVHAKWVNWKPADRPPVSLADALVVATDALKRYDKEYHCIEANLGQRITAADWEFLFASADGSLLWVNVGADRSTVVSKDEFFH